MLSKILAKCMQKGLESANLPGNTVQLVENTDREAVSAMLTSTEEIDTKYAPLGPDNAFLAPRSSGGS